MIRISIAEQGKSPQLLTYNSQVITLGRASQHELSLTGKGVSSTHCRIVRDAEGYLVEDLGSTNGTYVNRQRIQGRVRIGPQDEVVLAVYRLRVLADNESGANLQPPGQPGAGAQPGARPGSYQMGPPDPMTATPGVARSAPTAHMAPPSTAVPPMSGGHAVPGAAPPASMGGYPAAPGGYPPVGPGHDTSGAVPASPMQSTPSQPPGMAGHAGSGPSQPPGMAGHAGPSPSQPPGMGGQGASPSMAPSISPTAGSGAVPVGSGAVPGQTGGSGRTPSGGLRSDDLAWGREWERVDKLTTAWLTSGKSDAALLRGDKLEHALEWLAQGRGKQPPPKPVHQEFLMAGKRASQMRTFGIIMVVVLLLGGGGVGFWLWWSNRDQGTEIAGDPTGDGTLDLGSGVGSDADPSTPQSLEASDALAAEAQTQLIDDPVLATLLAIEALARLPYEVPAFDTSAYQVLRLALQRLPGRPLRGHTGRVELVALSADGRWAVTAEGGQGGNVRLWDLAKPGVPKPARLSGHGKSVTALEISRDGRWLVTADGDGLAIRWNLLEPDPSTVFTRLESHRSRITSIDIAADGRWLVSGDEAGQVKLWDLDAEIPRAVTLPKGHEARVTAVSINGPGTRVVSASEDMTSRNWRVADGKSTDRVPTSLSHGDEELPVQVTAVGIASDDSWGVSGGSDGIVRLWRPDTRIPQRGMEVLPERKGQITDILVTVDSSMAISVAEKDNDLLVTDLQAKVPSANSVRLPGHTAPIIDLDVFSMPAEIPAGRRVPTTALTASADGTARTFNLDKRKSGVESRVLSAGEGNVRAVAISADGQWVITGGDGDVARVWDWQSLPLDDGEPQQGLPQVGSASLVARGHASGVIAIGVDDFGRRMLTGSADGTARIWDLQEPGRVTALPVKDIHQAKVRAAAVSSSSKWGATGDEAGGLVVWNLVADTTAGLELQGHTGEIRQLAFTPEPERLISVSTDKSARVWKMTKNIQDDVVVLPHGDEVTQLALSGDGRWLLTGTNTSGVLWDLEADDVTKPVRTFTGHEDDLTAVALGPQGRWAATGSRDRRVNLYDLGEGGEEYGLRNHEEPISVLAFDSRGKWLATGSEDKSIRLWDLASEYPEEGSIELTGHEGAIKDLEWSPDGRWLISSDTYGALRMWDVRQKSAEEIAARAIVLVGHSSVVPQIALVAGDGERGLTKLVSASYDGTARVWPLEADELILVACTHAGRAITEEEWEAHIQGKYRPHCE